jgi:hypothetical protein
MKGLGLNKTPPRVIIESPPRTAGAGKKRQSINDATSGSGNLVKTLKAMKAKANGLSNDN